MSLNKDKLSRITQIVVFTTLWVMCLWGMVSVVAEVRPFWVDEWRIIYNLKYKDNNALWGQLAYMQQFPRTYLILIKQLTSHFNYSYQSLRAIPYLAGIATILYLKHLSKKVSDSAILRCIFVMMLVSSSTFTQYFVEVKQYTMELLMSVVAVGALMYVLELGNDGAVKKTQYTLFCLGMVVAPFFSYTFPIVIAPVLLVVLISHVQNALIGQKTPYTILVKQWLPLFLTIFGCTVFYAIDAVNVTKDKQMRGYWKHLLGDYAPIQSLPVHIFDFLAQSGSGFIFWWLFGICGVVGVVVVAKKTTHHLRIKLMLPENYLNLYALSTILFVIVLNIAGKLPLGEPRLNAFGIPSIAIILTTALKQMELKNAKIATSVSLLLLAGLTGNIYTTIIAAFTNSQYDKKMAIYEATKNAVTAAQGQGIPILITPGVAWPYDNTENLPFKDNVPGDWVLTTWPAYDVTKHTDVYGIPHLDSLESYLTRLPAGTKMAMVGDGLSYRVYAVPK